MFTKAQILGDGIVRVDAPRDDAEALGRLYREARRRDASRARAPVSNGRAAADALANARDKLRRAAESGRPEAISALARYVPSGIWRGRGGSDGATWNLGDGFGAPPMRWIESPESKGLRFAGLAHDIAPRRVGHHGWFLREDGWSGETVSGVVYRLPGRKGSARFVAGYADPYNEGPAALNLTRVLSEDVRGLYHGNTPDALTDAACEADSYAEIMAEGERERDAAYQAGHQARQAAAEARGAGRKYLAALRFIRQGFCARRMVPAEGIVSAATWRAGISAHIAGARRLRDDWRDARDAFREALDKAPGRRDGARDSWREGYDVGDF